MKLTELLNYDDLVIQCHDFPDADTLSCAYALSEYLKEHKKRVRIVYSGKQKITKPNLIQLIEYLDLKIEYVQEIKPPKVLVLVDCFYGEGNVTRFEADHIYIIDHHLCKNMYGFQAEVRNNYGSCTSVLAAMFEEVKYDYNKSKKVATALYYGLYTDTNSLSELRHPADRDLRDFAKYDQAQIFILKNSNLTLDEMKITGDALKNYQYNQDYKFALVETQPCDPNILGFISDLLIQVDKVFLCVVFCKTPAGTKISLRSCTSDIRANEMMEYIVKEIGSGGGHAQKAGGYIGNSVSDDLIQQYLINQIINYYQTTKIIHAKEYNVNLCQMKRYMKKPQPVGYVRATDILPCNTEICIRSLEADLNVTVDESLYIIIGILGEVYPISKKQFERDYIKTEEQISLMAEYVPNIIIKRSLKVIPLIPHIKACISSQQTRIYAKQLNHIVKIYTKSDSENYMLGNVGDYIAVQENDLQDICIIEQSLFIKNYREEIE